MTRPALISSALRRAEDNMGARVLVLGSPCQRRPERRELPPLPEQVTAHELRRAYISMMFAAGAEIPYVLAQVGHEDSKVTLQIEARVLKRRDGDEIGRAFDHLLLGRDEADTGASDEAENIAPQGSRAGQKPG